MRAAPRRFVDESLVEIIAYLRARLSDGQASVAILVLDPDLGRGCYAGEHVRHDGHDFVHRPWRLWVDLAARLDLHLSTPRSTGDGLVRLEFHPLDPSADWHAAPDTPANEKYGRDSDFQRISKPEDPDFVLDFADALERAAPPDNARILDLGVNTGDELALLEDLVPGLGPQASFVGVDHCASALEIARRRFAAPRHRFVEADLRALPELDLGTFDLVLCMSTMQSPGVDDRALLREIVQRHLSARGSVILGIPNCSYLDGELRYGAMMKNFRQPDLSLVIKGVAFYRRYLQQHRRRVFVTGKYHLLVTGVPHPIERSQT